MHINILNISCNSTPVHGFPQKKKKSLYSHTRKRDEGCQYSTFNKAGYLPYFLLFHVSTLLFFLPLPSSVFSKTTSQTRPNLLVGTGESDSHQSWQVDQGGDTRRGFTKAFVLGRVNYQVLSLGQTPEPPGLR